MTGVVNNPNKASSNSDQKIYDNLRKNSSNQGIYGILVPQQNVSFEFPQTAVTGNRMSQLNLVVNDVPIDPIAIGRDSGGVFMALDESLLGVPGVVFFMGADGAGGTASCAAARNTANCSYITNLKVNATVKENFNLVHNLPISSGGYLSLQKKHYVGLVVQVHLLIIEQLKRLLMLQIIILIQIVILFLTKEILHNQVGGYHLKIRLILVNLFLLIIFQWMMYCLKLLPILQIIYLIHQLIILILILVRQLRFYLVHLYLEG
jgi:hypothetical protein